MIKNQKQASVSEKRLQELLKAKQDLEAGNNDINDAKYRLGISALNSLITDLQNQLDEYKQLNDGNFNCLKAKSLSDLPNVLIAARLAQKMSQKDLANLVGIKEQQVQRYEASDYETASWPRIIEIEEALGIKCAFEKIVIINNFQDDSFLVPEGLSKEYISVKAQNLRRSHSLIFN
ncbi:MAG: helix-turn-helix transcriptional regulator [Candidatus Methylacidiphilales bacterium]